MTDEQIEKDRQERITKAKGELEAILRKYELDVAAEDMIGEHTKIKIMVQFVDTKRYPKATLAQEENPVISEKDLKETMEGPGDSIKKK